MSEGAIGILILIGISVIVAVLAHCFIRHYVLAVACTAFIASLAFNVAAYAHHPDPFVGLALVFGAVYSGGIAALIGVPFILYRRKKQAPVACTSESAPSNQMLQPIERLREQARGRGGGSVLT